MSAAFRRFINGIASSRDLFGPQAPVVRPASNGPAADADALRGDWGRVGQDLRRAIERGRAEFGSTAPKPQAE